MSGGERAQSIFERLVEALPNLGVDAAADEVKAAVFEYLIEFRNEIKRRPSTRRAVRMALADAELDAIADGRALTMNELAELYESELSAGRVRRRLRRQTRVDRHTRRLERRL